jgi:hypothetical protein
MNEEKGLMPSLFGFMELFPITLLKRGLATFHQGN